MFVNFLRQEILMAEIVFWHVDIISIQSRFHTFEDLFFHGKHLWLKTNHFEITLDSVTLLRWVHPEEVFTHPILEVHMYIFWWVALKLFFKNEFIDFFLSFLNRVASIQKELSQEIDLNHLTGQPLITLADVPLHYLKPHLIPERKLCLPFWVIINTLVIQWLGWFVIDFESNEVSKLILNIGRHEVREKIVNYNIPLSIILGSRLWWYPVSAIGIVRFVSNACSFVVALIFLFFLLMVVYKNVKLLTFFLIGCLES